MSTYAPFAKPLYVMLKPVGAVCNLACDYCYYLEKSKLYRDNPKHVMSEELLEKFIEEYINSQTMPQVLFTWHGGETARRQRRRGGRHRSRPTRTRCSPRSRVSGGWAGGSPTKPG